jgi:hypothetical protein
MTRQLLMIFLPVVLFLAACAEGDESEKKNGPKACQGQATADEPVGDWSIQTFDSTTGTTEEILLSIALTNTQVTFQCGRNGLVASASRLVKSAYEDNRFVLDRMGTLEASNLGLRCRMDDMGGVYKMTFSGSCMKLEASTRSWFFTKQ